MKIFKKKCIVCGKLFETTDNRKTKCTKECNNKYLSQKKKENWQNKEYRINQSKKIKDGQNNLETKQKMSVKKLNNKFRLGYKTTEETKKKLSESHKGQIPWNKNKVGIYSEETLQKISQNTKLSMNEEVRRKLSIIGKNRIFSEESKKKISNKLRNRSKKEIQNYINKVYNTKKKNNTFNTSKPEEDIYQLLLQKFNNVKRQYKSKKYPFNCDFYIPELDLYIEYQGFWHHGFKPYNLEDQECINLVNKWLIGNTKFYNKAIEIYTIKDPLKRKTAKENNLNWIEFFNMKEFMEWYND